MAYELELTNIITPRVLRLTQEPLDLSMKSSFNREREEAVARVAKYLERPNRFHK